MAINKSGRGTVNTQAIIDPAVHYAVKIYCIENRLHMRDFVADAVISQLEEAERKAAK